MSPTQLLRNPAIKLAQRLTFSIMLGSSFASFAAASARTSVAAGPVQPTLTARQYLAKGNIRVVMALTKIVRSRNEKTVQCREGLLKDLATYTEKFPQHASLKNEMQDGENYLSTDIDIFAFGKAKASINVINGLSTAENRDSTDRFDGIANWINPQTPNFVDLVKYEDWFSDMGDRKRTDTYYEAVVIFNTTLNCKYYQR